jgi:hypothetical protein
VIHALEALPTGGQALASSGKRKTTMAKLNRERRLLERRVEKKARKDARKRASALSAGSPGDSLTPSEPVNHPGQSAL